MQFTSSPFLRLADGGRSLLRRNQRGTQQNGGKNTKREHGARSDDRHLLECGRGSKPARPVARRTHEALGRSHHHGTHRGIPLCATRVASAWDRAMSDPLLVVLLGPTGSGKTALSLAIASAFHGEIVNCDSVSVYRELDIGTAKPSSEERSRAPHHLFDIVAPTEPMTAGAYARRARTVLAEIRE